jgi:hypothetical protein
MVPLLRRNNTAGIIPQESYTGTIYRRNSTAGTIPPESNTHPRRTSYNLDKSQSVITTSASLAPSSKGRSATPHCIELYGRNASVHTLGCSNRLYTLHPDDICSLEACKVAGEQLVPCSRCTWDEVCNSCGAHCLLCWLPIQCIAAQRVARILGGQRRAPSSRHAAVTSTSRCGSKPAGKARRGPGWGRCCARALGWPPLPGRPRTHLTIPNIHMLYVHSHRRAARALCLGA